MLVRFPSLESGGIIRWWYKSKSMFPLWEKERRKRMSIIDLPVIIFASLAVLLGLFWAFRVMMVAAVKMTASSIETIALAGYAAISLGLGVWAFAMVFA